jgi:hypothetical protein
MPKGLHQQQFGRFDSTKPHASDVKIMPEGRPSQGIGSNSWASGTGWEQTPSGQKHGIKLVEEQLRSNLPLTFSKGMFY